MQDGVGMVATAVKGAQEVVSEEFCIQSIVPDDGAAAKVQKFIRLTTSGYRSNRWRRV